MFNAKEMPFWLSLVMVVIVGVTLAIVTLGWHKYRSRKKMKNEVGSEINIVDNGEKGRVVVVAGKKENTRM